MTNENIYNSEHFAVLKALTNIYNTLHVIDLEKDIFYECELPIT